MDALIGLDVGTSSVKGVLIDLDGRLLTESECGHALLTPRPGWAEQDPAQWWRGAIAVLRELAAVASGRGATVLGMGLTGQMNGAVLLDAHGQVIRPCIIWADTRTVAECEEIYGRIPVEKVVNITGKTAVTGYTAPKLLWVRNHEPDNYRRIRHLLLPKDYVTWKLVGELGTDASDASNTLLFDIAERAWSGPILEALDISGAILPSVRTSSTIAGRLLAGAARETGLAPGLPVVIGAGDSIAEAVGNALVHQGLVLSVVGTAGNVSAVSEAPTIDNRGRIHTGCYAEDKRWIVTGVQQAAGLSMRWLLENLELYEELRHAHPEHNPYDLVFEQIETTPPGSDGLLFLPYLTGERTPHLDPFARGVFFGIGVHHHRAHFVRAVLEGIAFAQRNALDLLPQLHIEPTQIVVSGGGGQNQHWHQILADVTGLEVSIVDGGHGAAFGAALLAGVGSAVFQNIRDASSRCIRLRPAAEPRSATRTTYDTSYAVFCELYSELRSSFRRRSGS